MSACDRASVLICSLATSAFLPSSATTPPCVTKSTVVCASASFWSLIAADSDFACAEVSAPPPRSKRNVCCMFLSSLVPDEIVSPSSLIALADASALAVSWSESSSRSNSADSESLAIVHRHPSLAAQRPSDRPNVRGELDQQQSAHIQVDLGGIVVAAVG